MYLDQRSHWILKAGSQKMMGSKRVRCYGQLEWCVHCVLRLLGMKYLLMCQYTFVFYLCSGKIHDGHNLLE